MKIVKDNFIKAIDCQNTDPSLDFPKIVTDGVFDLKLAAETILS